MSPPLVIPCHHVNVVEEQVCALGLAQELSPLQSNQRHHQERRVGAEDAADPPAVLGLAPAH